MKKFGMFLVLLLACATAATAQVITGTILGSVTDSAGAPVQGATVQITNAGTNVTTAVKTNSDGEYSAPQLPPGVYRVEIQASGFQTYRQIDIRITLDQKVRVNAVLSPGNIQEEVIISSEGLQLQTDASDLNQSLSTREIENLPNIGRNPLRYTVTAPGVVGRGGFDNPTNINAGDDSRRQFSNFTVNGSRPNSSEILLDGAPNTSNAFNEVAVLPNLDAIGDFKIITNAYSAEFGRAGGGVVQFGTKSGANDFHGSLYEYARNSALNANTFANNLLGRKRGQVNLHQFGGSFSGPIFLPRLGEGGPALYEGRDKSFFFFSYEGLRARTNPISQILTVPTALERQGDFSQSRTTLSGVVVPRNIFAPFASTTQRDVLGSGQFRFRRAQFQDGGVLNRIPRQFINPVSQRLLNLYPLPNTAPLNPDGTGNYILSGSTQSTTNQFIARVDHNFNARTRLFVRYTQDSTEQIFPDLFAQSGVSSALNRPPATQDNPSGTVGITYTASSTSILDFRFNATRINLLQRPAEDTDLLALGFSPAVADASPDGFIPRVEIGGFQAIGVNAFTFRDNHSTNISFTGSYTRVLSKVTSKLGGEYRVYLNNFYQPFHPGLAFGTTNLTTSCAGAQCPSLPTNRSEGFTLADFLIGSLDGLRGGGQFTTADPAMAIANKYLAFYSQNDWQVRPNLTLNLGFRYEIQLPLTERFDRISQFDTRVPNATGTRGSYEFANFGGNSRGQTETDFKNFAPRVGFAFRPDDRTVIRAAYGISYDIVTGVGSGAQGFGPNGFDAPAFVRIRPLNNDPILERPFNDAFNGGGVAIGRNPNLLLGRPEVVAIRREQPTPYVQQWNLTFERELPGRIKVETSYVGTKGTNLTVQTTNINGVSAIDQTIIDNARQTLIETGLNPLDQRVPNPFFGIIPTGNPNISGPTVTQLQLARPFPAYGDVVLFQERYGSSNYHAGQVNVRRAFSQGIEIGGYYVFSKNIDFGTSLTARNDNNLAGGPGATEFAARRLDLDRSVSPFDIKHRSVIYSVADLPFGKDRRFLSDVPVLSQILGGFRLSGIATFSSGVPLGISGGGGFGRPDLIGDPRLPEEFRCVGDGVKPCPLPGGGSVIVGRNRQLYFNPNAFRSRTISVPVIGDAQGRRRVIVDPYYFGTSPRYIDSLRGPAVNNFDLTLARDFRITENTKLEARVEAINVFNHTLFSEVGIDKNFGGTALFNESQAPSPTNDPNRIGQSTSANFGTLNLVGDTSQRTPRFLQVSLRFVF